jgi:hypothetical protein
MRRRLCGTDYDDGGWEFVDGDEGDEDAGPGEAPDSVVVGFLRAKAQVADARLTGRKRELGRVDPDKIKASFESLVGKPGATNKYTCCKKGMCLHEDRDQDKPFLLDVALQLRQGLALQTDSGQRDVVYELLRARWGTWFDPKTKSWKKGLHEGYGIPEVHGGTQICRYYLKTVTVRLWQSSCSRSMRHSSSPSL